MNTSTDKPDRILTLGHSPDADDAFMFYALARGKIDTGALRYEHTLQDIETLNRRAERGELDVTALSVHAYAYVADKYAILSSGASVGDEYGPIVVAKEPLEVGALRGRRIAVPGEWTTAYLSLRLCLGEFESVVVPFDEVFPAVLEGQAEAGLVIHEGQLTYADANLHHILDLGRWWAKRTGGLPLPLGVNAIRKSLGPALLREIGKHLRASIEYGLAHRREALDYALSFGRGLMRDDADRFVGMYVNDFTVDLGERGRRGIEVLLEQAAEQGWIPGSVQPEFIDCH